MESFIEEQCKIAIDKGNLSGVLLVGLGTVDGTTLLRHYMQDTGDIQTTCLANILGVGEAILSPWLDTYFHSINFLILDIVTYLIVGVFGSFEHVWIKQN